YAGGASLGDHRPGDPRHAEACGECRRAEERTLLRNGDPQDELVHDPWIDGAVGERPRRDGQREVDAGHLCERSLPANEGRGPDRTRRYGDVVVLHRTLRLARSMSASVLQVAMADR